MQLKIYNGAVDLSGTPVLKDINIEINTASRIAVVGRNGCGKTTLLRAIYGALPFSFEGDGFFAVSGDPIIGVLDQMTFRDESVSMLEEIRSAYSDILDVKKRLDEALKKMESDQSDENIREYTSLLDVFTNLGGFYFEKEYEAAIKKFGFSDEDKARPVSEFSGGQRTKIAFLKLLLSKPDLLLLDEPTNHLDINAVMWLEDYIRDYKKAVLIVSHDRMFLDRTVNEVYEIEYGKSEHYSGNYSDFVRQKKERAAILEKEYETQQKEIEHLNSVVEKFRYKATKAKMAQSKIKQLERMDIIDAPRSADTRVFKTSLEPSVRSAKEVLSVTGLKIGFDSVLSTVDFSMLRGQRLGIIGGNGLGKSTLLKTLVGKIPPLGGEYRFGAMVNIGYFDQQLAQYSGSISVFDAFASDFPSLNDFEVRSALAAFLFSGEDVYKTLDMLSGGEKVRLALCKLFRKQPNFLILDEPTNHMDIASKEALEDLLCQYSGTLIFVSHDRYFIKKLSDRLLVFENGITTLYDYGYEQYMQSGTAKAETPPQPEKEKPEKKTYTTPAKEKAKRERAIRNAEEKISLLEEKIGGLKEELNFEENRTDYIRLSEIQAEIDETEEELLIKMSEWENLTSIPEE